MVTNNNPNREKEEIMTDITRSLFGETDASGCIPSMSDSLATQCDASTGPVFSDDGRLIVGESWTPADAASETAKREPAGSDHFVEAWRVWDCYEENWAPCPITLYRFENNDYVVRMDAYGNACSWTGAVDTQARILASTDPKVNNECCWQWLRDDR